MVICNKIAPCSSENSTVLWLLKLFRKDKKHCHCVVNSVGCDQSLRNITPVGALVICCWNEHSLSAKKSNEVNPCKYVSNFCFHVSSYG